MIKSISDTIAQRLAPVYRKLNDMKIKLLGSKINIMILKVTDTNALDDKDTEVTSTKEIYAHIVYPSEITIFRGRDSDGNLIDDKAIFLEDVLPIEMYVTMDDINNTIEEGDIIIHLLWDENNNCIPQVFKVARALGAFKSKEQIMKKFILSNIRTTMNDTLMTAVRTYISANLR